MFIEVKQSDGTFASIRISDIHMYKDNHITAYTPTGFRVYTVKESHEQIKQAIIKSK